MKMHLSKINWAIRAIIYKPLFKKLSMPSYIGKPVFIEGVARINIGKKVRIFPGIRMEAHKNGSITINDDVYIGQNCHLTSEDSDLNIGEGTAIMANVCVTNIDHNYEEIGVPILNQGYTTRKTRIGKNCFIGHGSVIQAGAEIEDHVIVGANSVICRGKVPANCVIVGSPAKIVKQFNKKTGKWDKV